MASSGQRLGVLLNILQGTGQLLAAKNYPAQYIHKAKIKKLLLATIGTAEGSR